MWRVGHNIDPEEAFNLRRRVYPLDFNASMAEPTVAMSPASGRLLAAEEGHIGVYSGDEVMKLDPPVGKHLRELHLGQAHRPLPRHQEMSLPSRIYSGDAQFGHEGVLLHLGTINTGWYDPLGRGAEVRYSPYHPQYILPLPFAPRQYTSYANDLMIHLQPNAMGHGHYANAPPPFHGPHATEYDNPNGDCELPAYQHAVSQSVDLGRSNNPNTTPTKDYEIVRVVVYLRGVQRGYAEEGERGSTPTG